MAACVVLECGGVGSEFGEGGGRWTRLEERAIGGGIGRGRLLQAVHEEHRVDVRVVQTAALEVERVHAAGLQHVREQTVNVITRQSEL